MKTAGALVALVLLHAIARSECVTLNAKSVMAEKNIELAFSGKVVEITKAGEMGTRVTFDVDRVWKGSVPKRFTLYVWASSPEMPHFTKDQHQLAFAHKLTDPPARLGLGVKSTDGVVYAPVQCTDPSSLPPDLERELGPGHAPKGE
jgi:hypothetical protein